MENRFSVTPVHEYRAKAKTEQLANARTQQLTRQSQVATAGEEQRQANVDTDRRDKTYAIRAVQMQNADPETQAKMRAAYSSQLRKDGLTEQADALDANPEAVTQTIIQAGRLAGHLPKEEASHVSPSVKNQDSELFATLAANPNRTPVEEERYKYLQALLPKSLSESITGDVEKAKALDRVEEERYARALQDENSPESIALAKHKQSISQSQAKIKGAEEKRASDASYLIEDIDVALGQLDEGEFWRSGFVGKISSSIPGTPGYKLNEALEPVKGRVAIETLGEMRKASPTGGALGNVSDTEVKMLQSVVGSFDIGQDAPTLRRNLNRLRDMMNLIANGDESGVTLTDSDISEYRSVHSIEIPESVSGEVSDEVWNRMPITAQIQFVNTFK